MPLRTEERERRRCALTLAQQMELDPKAFPASALSAEHAAWNAEPKFCEAKPLYDAKPHTPAVHRFQSNVAPCIDPRASKLRPQRQRGVPQTFDRCKLASYMRGHGGNGPIKVWVVDKNGRRRWEM
jgi:hypothetical protein